jgi:predicted acetyltransferase
VSYRFAGWSKEPYTMKVVDLVAATAESYRELWRYLGSIDLVQRIAWPLAPVEDPLPWALQDGRGYSAKSAEDVLWLRILDPVGALQARHYDGEGRLSLEIVDPLGLAGGRFSLEAAGGNARVQPLAPEDAVDLSVDVDVLGALYLGGVTAGTLAAAGRLAGANDEAIRKLERIFATAAQPYCITHF